MTGRGFLVGALLLSLMVAGVAVGGLGAFLVGELLLLLMVVVVVVWKRTVWTKNERRRRMREDS